MGKVFRDAVYQRSPTESYEKILAHFKSIAPKVLFGPGKLKELHSETLPGKKALIVTSNGISVKKYGYLESLETELDKAGVAHALFDRRSAAPLRRGLSDHFRERILLIRLYGNQGKSSGIGDFLCCGKCRKRRIQD